MRPKIHKMGLALAAVLLLSACATILEHEPHLGAGEITSGVVRKGDEAMAVRSRSIVWREPVSAMAIPPQRGHISSWRAASCWTASSSKGRPSFLSSCSMIFSSTSSFSTM